MQEMKEAPANLLGHRETNPRCPLCQEVIYVQYGLKSAESAANWYHCRCGFMFTTEKVESGWTKEARKDFEGMKRIEDRIKYYIRMYAAIIEEKTYGRRMLDVGFCSPVLINEMTRRGWLATGIDIIPNEYITGDFMTHNLEGERFDLVWMGDFLQCVKNPVEAIYKAYKMLRPNGLLFISTPNTDLIKRNAIPMWGHWDMTKNTSFINEKILRDALMKCDASMNGRMEILYFDRDQQSNRFPVWNNMHVIAQKIKIEDNPIFEAEEALNASVT